MTISLPVAAHCPWWHVIFAWNDWHTRALLAPITRHHIHCQSCQWQAHMEVEMCCDKPMNVNFEAAYGAPADWSEWVREERWRHRLIWLFGNCITAVAVTTNWIKMKLVPIFASIARRNAARVERRHIENASGAHFFTIQSVCHGFSRFHVRTSQRCEWKCLN